jgi:hypothetical protein
MNALTKSGSTADSTFLLVNTTTGANVLLTWTKATGFVTQSVSLVFQNVGQRVALIQTEEDGTTELANASFNLYI